MERINVEVVCESMRRSKLIEGSEVERYVKLAKDLGISVNQDDNKVSTLTIEYFPGTFPEFDTSDDLDILKD